MKKVKKLALALNLIIHAGTAMATVMHVVTTMMALITIPSRLKQKLSDSVLTLISDATTSSQLIFKKGE